MVELGSGSSAGGGLQDLFRCPTCKGALQHHSDSSALICDSCALTWPVQDGIPCFLPKAVRRDYSLTTDMAMLVEIAKDRGWQEALEKHVAQTVACSGYVREYIASEARADFRFLMSLERGATVLDVGSGWGNISIASARNCDLVFALDTTLANLQFIAIRAQQEGLGNVVPVLGDATCLPIPPASCDGVLMVGVLGWVPWERNDGTPQRLQTRALREAFQALRPGGQLYLGIENRLGFKAFLGAREPHTGLRFISLLPRFLANYYSEMTRHRPFREWTYSQRELTRLLSQVGFKPIHFYYPIPSYQNIRYITDYGTPGISRFLASRFKGHGRFSRSLHMAGLFSSLLRVEKLLSPCFSVLAEKPDA